MTVNNVIAIVLLIFIALLAVSTVLVSIELFKELKKSKKKATVSVEKEAEE